MDIHNSGAELTTALFRCAVNNQYHVGCLFKTAEDKDEFLEAMRESSKDNCWTMKRGGIVQFDNGSTITAMSCEQSVNSRIGRGRRYHEMLFYGMDDELSQDVMSIYQSLLMPYPGKLKRPEDVEKKEEITYTETLDNFLDEFKISE